MAAKQRDRPLDAEFHYGAELPDECAQLELKSSFDHADIARTVCGLLNCVGGVMLIGAGDDGVVRGIPAAAPGVLVTRATRVVGPKGEDAEWTFGAEDEAYAAEQKVGAMPAVEEAKTATAVRNR